MSVFKANDIRGRYPGEWDGNTAYRIGLALSYIFKGDRIVVGRDGRDTSTEIFTLLTRGMTDNGLNVYDIGLVDTPSVYFTVGKYEFDGGIMITASHNPEGYNGIKITGKNTVPIEYEGGIRKLEQLVNGNDKLHRQSSSGKKTAGKVEKLNIEKEYLSFLGNFKSDYSGLRAVFDCSNGAAGRFIRGILSDFKGDSIIINEEIDGSFPAHGPNPSSPGSLDQVRETVLKSGADIGFCFDGDADRVVMVDDEGNSVSPDLITAAMSLYLLDGNERSKVLVDIRSSNSIGEFLVSSGADPVMCPVGHARIKKMLRETDALYGGELTGHYYFRDNYYCDSAWITVFIMLNVVRESGERLSSLSRRIMKYAFSGEKSFKLSDSEKQDLVIKKLMERYSDADIDLLDGVRFNFPDWWFIIRKSGTEPLLRLVLEADTQEKMNTKLEIVSKAILENMS